MLIIWKFWKELFLITYFWKNIAVYYMLKIFFFIIFISKAMHSITVVVIIRGTN